MAHQFCSLQILLALFSIYHSGMGHLDCSLLAAVNTPKYLECPLIHTSNEISFSGGASGLTIVNVSWYIEYCLFLEPCYLLHIDHYGIYNNHGYPSIAQNFEVTSSGQLYISSVGVDMRSTTFKCSIWNESTSYWIQSHTIGPLPILDYPPLYMGNDQIPKSSFQEPRIIEEAAIGANKVLCMQGEVLEAQVEWTRLEPNYQELYQVNSNAYFSTLTSRCFECGCMVDFLSSNEGLQLLNSIGESAKHISLTATEHYLPQSQSYEAFIASLECIGIPNWFLSVLLINNVTQSDAGNYEVTVRSTRSRLINYTTNFILNIDYLQIEPTFHYITAVNSGVRTTEYIAEGITTYYICNATIPISSFIVWRRLDNKKVPIVKHVTPLNSVVHNNNDLCQVYAEDRDTMSLTISNSTLYTSEGLVRQQIVALVICNMKPSTVGMYQCIAQSSTGEVTSGPQISIEIIPSTTSPSQTNNNSILVPYLAVGCAVITILLLLAIVVIVITHFWLRYQSKRLKPGNTVMHRRREENIYYDAHPHNSNGQ